MELLTFKGQLDYVDQCNKPGEGQQEIQEMQ